ncbi:UNKNOWN [Stylonychia lemnae]|uniref:Uncharacterized protein n=1 Tax=Stylonychia lemnae TaxID=5949 RepID=A0A078B3Z4_STYLE|nr:UNKNOWN [Stylonychia lemnae]|eukprot:CDW87907.1 UNKNOWN [Stylonychia lemnae]
MQPAPIVEKSTLVANLLRRNKNMALIEDWDKNGKIFSFFVLHNFFFFAQKITFSNSLPDNNTDIIGEILCGYNSSIVGDYLCAQIHNYLWVSNIEALYSSKKGYMGLGLVLKLLSNIHPSPTTSKNMLIESEMLDIQISTLLLAINPSSSSN